jgi:hypothetical protein
MFPVYCPDAFGIGVRISRNTHKEEYSLKTTKYNKTPFIDVLISAGIYLLLKKDDSYINSLNRISTAIPRNESKT